MSSVHHSCRPVFRPDRCLRHHVWMAACGDCRAAHAVPVRDRRETSAAAR